MDPRTSSEGQGKQQSEPLVRVEGLSKRFGSVQAVDNVSLEIRRGEILAIVGDNGAGKSTLVKMIAGALQPDSGWIYVNGRRFSHFSDVHVARMHGIEMLYQDLGLVDTLDVAANLFLGRELKFGGAFGFIGLLRQGEMRRRAESGLRRLGVEIPNVTGTSVAELSGGERQAVAVARSIFWASRVLILDEPTAALGVSASQQVLRLIEQARDSGTGVVVISHILPHVIALADRVMVMRHGRKAAEFERDEVSHEKLISSIVGI